MEKKITRSFNFEVRAENNDQYGDYIEGQPIVFETATDIGPFDEIIDRNALRETDLKDVRFLINHNTEMVPLARSRNNNENSTMQLSVVEEGMRMRANLDTAHNSDAEKLYSATRRGDISGMSFMMAIRGEEWDWTNEDHPTRRITDISRIFEVSAVTWPAYESTTLEARSDEEALESAKSALESAKAEAEKEAERKADMDELDLLLDELEEKNDD